jgi:hypothetical protein
VPTARIGGFGDPAGLVSDGWAETFAKFPPAPLQNSLLCDTELFLKLSRGLTATDSNSKGCPS